MTLRNSFEEAKTTSPWFELDSHSHFPFGGMCMQLICNFEPFVWTAELRTVCVRIQREYMDRTHRSFKIHFIVIDQFFSDGLLKLPSPLHNIAQCSVIHMELLHSLWACVNVNPAKKFAHSLRFDAFAACDHLKMCMCVCALRIL